MKTGLTQSRMARNFISLTAMMVLALIAMSMLGLFRASFPLSESTSMRIGLGMLVSGLTLVVLGCTGDRRLNYESEKNDPLFWRSLVSMGLGAGAASLISSWLFSPVQMSWLPWAVGLNLAVGLLICFLPKFRATEAKADG